LVRFRGKRKKHLIGREVKEHKTYTLKRRAESGTNISLPCLDEKKLVTEFEEGGVKHQKTKTSGSGKSLALGTWGRKRGLGSLLPRELFITHKSPWQARKEGEREKRPKDGPGRDLLKEGHE